MHIRRTLAPLAALLLAGLGSQAAQAACYVVYGADRQVVYRAQTPPVDMSRHLHETLPLVAPGGTMVFSLSSDGCELEVNRLPVAGSARAGAALAGERALLRRGALPPRTPRG